MKQFFFFFLSIAVSLIGCQTEFDYNHTEEVPLLPTATKLFIPEGVEVKIVDTTLQKIVIQTPEQYSHALQVHQYDDEIHIKNKQGTFWNPTQPLAKISINIHSLTHIYSETSFRVYSEDTLRFPNLYIRSSIKENGSATAFDLLINNQSLYIQGDQTARFDLKGKTTTFIVKLYGGYPIVDAKNLKAKTADLFHRSVQDISCDASDTLRLKLMSTGNLFLYGNPTYREVTQVSSGTLIEK